MVPSSMEVEVDGERFSVRIISVEGSAVSGVPAPAEKIPREDMEGGVKSNMQGMVLEVKVTRGATVAKGDILLVIEAMKMENPIQSPWAGKVTEIFVEQGDLVQSGDVLLVVQ
jgi:pyruvate carboxylase subunit B